MQIRNQKFYSIHEVAIFDNLFDRKKVFRPRRLISQKWTRVKNWAASSVTRRLGFFSIGGIYNNEKLPNNIINLPNDIINLPSAKQIPNNCQRLFKMLTIVA